MDQSNDFPRMMYRAPGAEDVQGHKVETCVVDYEEAQHVAQAAGWSLTVAEAVAAVAPAVESAKAEGDPLSAQADKILQEAQAEAVAEVAKIKASASDEAAKVVAAAHEEAAAIVAAAKKPAAVKKT